MNTRDDVLATISVVVGHGTRARTEKVADIAQIIRAAGEYRWVGIYDVSSNEIAAVAWTGPDAPAYPRFPATQGGRDVEPPRLQFYGVNDRTDFKVNPTNLTPTPCGLLSYSCLSPRYTTRSSLNSLSSPAGEETI